MKLPDDDLKRSKHIGVVLCVSKCFKWKLYRCICWLIVEVILRNARSNNEIHTNLVFVSRFSSLLQYQVTWKCSKYEAFTTEACLRTLTGEGTAEKIIKGTWLKCHWCKRGILHLQRTLWSAAWTTVLQSCADCQMMWMYVLSGLS